MPGPCCPICGRPGQVREGLNGDYDSIYQMACPKRHVATAWFVSAADAYRQWLCLIDRTRRPERRREADVGVFLLGRYRWLMADDWRLVNLTAMDPDEWLAFRRMMLRRRPFTRSWGWCGRVHVTVSFPDGTHIQWETTAWWGHGACRHVITDYGDVMRLLFDDWKETDMSNDTVRLFDLDDMIDVIHRLGLRSSIPAPPWQDTDRQLAEDILSYGTDPRSMAAADRYGLWCRDDATPEKRLP